MKSVAFVFAVLLAVQCLAQRGAEQHAVEKQLARYTQAIAKKDMKTVEAIMLPGFKSISSKGVTKDYKESLATYSQLFAQSRKISLTCAILSFKADRGVARLQSRYLLDVEVPGEGKGNYSKLHTDSTVAQVWMLADGSWRIKSSKQIAVKATLNGKPLADG